MSRPGAVDLRSPVDWAHPLNRGRLLWLHGLPAWAGGGTWRDLCRRHDATVAGGPGWVQSPGYGASPSLDGADDYAAVPYSARLDGLAAVAVAAWVYPAAAADAFDVVASRGYDGVTIPWALDVDDTDHWRFITFGPSSGSALSSTTVTACVGRWNRLAGVYGSDGTLRLYLDGVANGTTGTGFTHSSARDLRVGALDLEGVSSRFFNGVVADVSAWGPGSWAVASPAAFAAADYEESRRGYPRALRRARRARHGDEPALGWEAVQARPAARRVELVAY